MARANLRTSHRHNPRERKKKVATCHAKLIRRRRIIDNFHDDMEEPTEWTWEVSPFPAVSSDALFRPA
jgi:hypothetical protein